MKVLPPGRLVASALALLIAGALVGPAEARRGGNKRVNARRARLHPIQATAAAGPSLSALAAARVGHRAETARTVGWLFHAREIHAGLQGLAPVVLGKRTTSGPGPWTYHEELVISATGLRLQGRATSVQYGVSHDEPFDREIEASELEELIERGAPFEVDGAPMSARSIAEAVVPDRLRAIAQRRRGVAVDVAGLARDGAIHAGLRGLRPVVLGRRDVLVGKWTQHQALIVDADGVAITGRSTSVQYGFPHDEPIERLPINDAVAAERVTTGPEFELDGQPLTTERIELLLRTALSN